jgi:nucleoside-diphosphate-sugar epimerase
VTRVLVTGASGFIGRHLARQLADRGDEVHGIAHTAQPQLRGVRWHRADLLDPGAPALLMRRVRPDRLVHAAWYAKPRECWESPANIAWTEASLRLLRAFADAGGRRAVLVGSVFEYDWSGGVCREGVTPLRPATLYGSCKAALSSIVTAAPERLGVDLAWGRVFWLYGPHEPPNRLVSSVIEGLLAGRRVAVTAGAQKRDYLHVDDVAGALVALLDSDVAGAVNVGSGAAVPVRTIFDRLGDLLGRPELLDIGGRQEAAVEPPVVVADVARLAREVRFSPQFDLDSGLEHTIAWWRELIGGRRDTSPRFAGAPPRATPEASNRTSVGALSSPPTDG